MKTNQLHKNIKRLSAIITSGKMITDNSDDDDEWTTSTHEHGKKLTNHQTQMHINALVENLEALRKITPNSPTS